MERSGGTHRRRMPGTEVPLTPQQRKRIFELTSGLPLPIKLGIARMAGGESFALVERWLGDATGELPEYCVKGQAELSRRRNLNAWTVLVACAFFERSAGASREAFPRECGYLYCRSRQGSAPLSRLFLVNRCEGDRFSVLPIVQRYRTATACLPPPLRLPNSQHSGTRLCSSDGISWLDRFAWSGGVSFFKMELREGNTG